MESSSFEQANACRVAVVGNAKYLRDFGGFKQEVNRFFDRCGGDASALGIRLKSNAYFRRTPVVRDIDADVSNEVVGFGLGNAQLYPFSRGE